MKSEIILKLQAQDFNGTHFMQGQCAIEKALSRQEGVYALEAVKTTVLISESDRAEYEHEYYGYDDFNQDKEACDIVLDRTTVIRTLTLKKL